MLPLNVLFTVLLSTLLFADTEQGDCNSYINNAYACECSKACSSSYKDRGNNSHIVCRATGVMTDHPRFDRSMTGKEVCEWTSVTLENYDDFMLDDKIFGSGFVTYELTLLNYPRLTNINDNTFTPMLHLEHIIFAHTTLASIPTNALVGIESLKKVTFTSNRRASGLLLKQLPNWHWLQELTLHDNGISEMGSHVLEKLDNLKRFELVENDGLTAIPTNAFSDLRSLRQIRIVGKLPISSMDQYAFYKLPKLNRIEIRAMKGFNYEKSTEIGSHRTATLYLTPDAMMGNNALEAFQDLENIELNLQLPPDSKRQLMTADCLQFHKSYTLKTEHFQNIVNFKVNGYSFCANLWRNLTRLQHLSLGVDHFCKASYNKLEDHVCLGTLRTPRLESMTFNCTNLPVAFNATKARRLQSITEASTENPNAAITLTDATIATAPNLQRLELTNHDYRYIPAVIGTLTQLQSLKYNQYRTSNDQDQNDTDHQPEPYGHHDAINCHCSAIWLDGNVAQFDLEKARCIDEDGVSQTFDAYFKSDDCCGTLRPPEPYMVQSGEGCVSLNKEQLASQLNFNSSRPTYCISAASNFRHPTQPYLVSFMLLSCFVEALRLVV